MNRYIVRFTTGTKVIFNAEGFELVSGPVPFYRFFHTVAGRKTERASVPAATVLIVLDSGLATSNATGVVAAEDE